MTSIFSLDPSDLMAECEDTARFMFDDADSIGSSDISCATMDVLKSLGLDPYGVSDQEFQMVRGYVRSCILELHDRA